MRLQSRPHLVVHLAADRLEAAVFRKATVVGARRRSLPTADAPERWAGGLRSLDPALTQIVSELDAHDLPAVLLHDSQAATGVFSCPKSAPFEDAALLALAERADLTLDEHPHLVLPIGVDRGKNKSAQRHVLVTAERDDRARIGEDFLSRAGLRPVRTLPVRAALDALTTRTLLNRSADRPTVLLRIGETGSVIAAGPPGAVSIVRSVQVGVSALVDALSAPIDSVRAGKVHLDRDTAEDLLYSKGIPERNAELSGVPGVPDALTGACVLPVLAPALQRLANELRQSLRFGLSADDRNRAVVVLDGPGAALRRLAAVLHDEIGLETTAAPDASEFRPRTPFSPGGDARAAITMLRTFGPRFDVPSIATQRARKTRAVKRAMLAGAGVAAAAAIGSGVLTAQHTAALEDQLATLRPAAEAARAAQAEAEAVTAMRARVTAARAAVDRTLGLRPEIPAFLAELGALAPPAVRFTDLSIDAAQTDADSIGGRAELSGYVFVDPNPRDDRAASLAGDADTLFTEFIRRLGDSPLVASAELGATQSTVVDGRDATRFSLTVELVGAPLRVSADADRVMQPVQHAAAVAPAMPTATPRTEADR